VTLYSGTYPAVAGAGLPKQMGNLLHRQDAKDLAFVKELIEAGRVVPVVDKRYPLHELAEAFCYFGEGHARGKVVITVEHNAKT
jgi:NADPH:quinone reductase-like Zn-dependent oxidoreductase